MKTSCEWLDKFTFIRMRRFKSIVLMHTHAQMCAFVAIVFFLCCFFFLFSLRTFPFSIPRFLYNLWLYLTPLRLKREKSLTLAQRLLVTLVSGGGIRCGKLRVTHVDGMYKKCKNFTGALRSSRLCIRIYRVRCTPIDFNIWLSCVITGRVLAGCHAVALPFNSSVCIFDPMLTMWIQRSHASARTNEAFTAVYRIIGTIWIITAIIAQIKFADKWQPVCLWFWICPLCDHWSNDRPIVFKWMASVRMENGRFPLFYACSWTFSWGSQFLLHFWGTQCMVRAAKNR